MPQSDLDGRGQLLEVSYDKGREHEDRRQIRLAAHFFLSRCVIFLAYNALGVFKASVKEGEHPGLLASAGYKVS